MEKSDNKINKRIMSIAVILFVAGLLFGFNSSVTNGSLSFMTKDLQLSALQQGTVTSSLVIACGFGAFFGGNISDRIGRKPAIRIISWLSLIGALGCALSFNIVILVVFRFILGLSVGATTSVVPLYLGEIADSNSRGRLVGYYNTMGNVGQCLVFLTNAVLGTIFLNTAGIWKVMVGLAIIPALILLIGNTKILESPRWLVKNGKLERAIQIIKDIYRNDEKTGENEISELKNSAALNAKENSAVDTKTPKWALKVLFLGIFLAVLQQCVGINSIMYYGSSILTNYGFSQQSSLIFNVLNGVIAALASFVGVSFVDKFGRKSLMLGGLSFSALMLIIVSVAPKFLSGSAEPYVIMLIIFAYVFGFQGTIGPVTWIWLSEIFPDKYRGKFNGIAVFFLWFANFLISLYFPVAVQDFGINATFYFFAICSIIGFIVILFLLPETKGKTLEEIEEGFKK